MNKEPERFKKKRFPAAGIKEKGVVGMAEKAKRFHQKCRAACWLIVITQLAVLFLR
ncbi:hypothetical protein [Holdemania filiformis]|uniref:Uncharacterized protein n=1 Tax=Holdemania filiformis DSM 12042 TaxID=545696 RepID=B9YAT8_9FIRM|nr:hypothetical protein HOLDEFILI_02945 [Holdemania filiformis DSM 12042]